MRKLFNRAMAFIVIVGAIYYWMLQGRHETAAQRSGYGWNDASYLAEVHEMRGDALGARAYTLWRMK